MRREHLGSDRQPRVFRKPSRSTTLSAKTKRFGNLLADDLTKAGFLFHNQNVIGRFGQNAFTDALGQDLQGVAHFPGAQDAVVDEFIETGWRLLAEITARADDE